MKNISKLKDKHQIHFKYRIRERLESLSYEEHQLAIKILPKALNISQRTFYRYVYTRLSERYSMPVDHLARLAKFFNCRIEDLLNYEPQPVKIDGIRKKDKSSLVNKFRFVKD